MVYYISMTEGIDNTIFEAVRAGVVDCLGGDDSGHGMDHVDRVEAMSIRFCEHYLGVVDAKIVRLAALLHDVDDYKLVGLKKGTTGQLENAVAIMNAAGIDGKTQVSVRKIIVSIGYKKALQGIRPESIEGKIVSDADMCDASGVAGAIRALQYAVGSKGSGVVFDPSVWPDLAIGADKYNADGNTHEGDSFLNYFFEKLFRLKDMMLTVPGAQEATVRDEIMIDILRHYFREQNVPEWSEFLEDYLANR